MCLKSWSSNYEQLLLEARLPILKVRRSALSLSHLYKIINKLTYPDPPIIQRKVPYSNRGINANTVCIPHACNYYCISTVLSKTSVWNLLPEGVTSCSSITGFKCHLKQILVIYNIYIQVCLMSQSWDNVASMHGHLLSVHVVHAQTVSRLPISTVRMRRLKRLQRPHPL